VQADVALIAEIDLQGRDRSWEERGERNLRCDIAEGVQGNVAKGDPFTIDAYEEKSAMQFIPGR
jgi:hypothetical protein